MSDPEIHVAGLEEIGATYRAAAHWRDGKVTRLSSGEREAWAGALWVGGGHVYVAGSDERSAVYWKDGEMVTLARGDWRAEAHAIQVIGDDVYVVGREGDARGRDVARCWVNGRARPLAVAGPGMSVARAVWTDGTQVHVGGNDGRTAVWWTDGERRPLTDGARDAQVSALCGAGGDVHAAGFDHGAGGVGVATWWKNGVATALTDGTRHAQADSIFVAGDGVYVGGWEYDDQEQITARCWKNGAPLALALPGQVVALFVSGDDVYTWVANVARRLFKNGVEVPIAGRTRGDALHAIWFARRA